MTDRYYDIELSCGCLLSLDGGGGLMPCYSDNCKYLEEHLLHPDWVRRELEIFKRNYYENPPTEEKVEKVKKGLEKEYKVRLEKFKNKPKIIEKEKVIEKYYGHPDFYKILDELKELHSKKNYNYASSDNPLSNFYQSEKFGIPAPYGCLVRMSDKDCRRIEVLLKGDIVGETIIDTSKDDSVYNIIFTILWKEFLKNKNAEKIMKMIIEIKKLLEEGK